MMTDPRGEASSAAAWLAAGCSELPATRQNERQPKNKASANAGRIHNKAPPAAAAMYAPLKVPLTSAPAPLGKVAHIPLWDPRDPLRQADMKAPPPQTPPGINMPRQAGGARQAQKVQPHVPPGIHALQAPPPPPAPAMHRGGWTPELEAWSTSTKSWYHPRHYKKRYCAWYPDSAKCRRGDGCAFAHSRDEVRAPLLTAAEEEQDPSAMTEEFFMYKFKTRWCPIGIQHNWQTCVYAHNYQDARRDVSIGYGSAACPHWNRHETGAEYWQRCPLGVHCPYAHGAKETLYHPEVFRTVVCRDRCDRSACPRQRFCAFFHGKHQVRRPATSGVDYRKPLPVENMDPTWLDDFLTQPFPPGENATAMTSEMAMAEQLAWQHYAAQGGAPAPWMMGTDQNSDPYKGLEAAVEALASSSPRTQSTAECSSSEKGGELALQDDDPLGIWNQQWAFPSTLPHYPLYASQGY